MAYYSRPEEVLQAFVNLFDANKERLGFNYVAVQDENLVTEYPALQISAGPVLRDIHGTQKFLVVFEMNFWIYHAYYEETHRQRSIKDMELATDVVQFLHTKENRNLIIDGEQKIIFGFVTGEIPGQVRTDVGTNRIIATRISWQGETEVNFDDS